MRYAQPYRKAICRVSVVVGAVLILSPSIGKTCGDKFLVKNKNVTKAQCLLSGRPGAILIYQSSNDEATEKALGKSTQRALINIGHEVDVVESQAAFEDALKNESYDVVLAWYAQVDAAEGILRAAGKSAHIVPVVAKANEAEVVSAKARFGSVIKDTERTSTKLLIINETVAATGENQSM